MVPLVSGIECVTAARCGISIGAGGLSVSFVFFRVGARKRSLDNWREALSRRFFLGFMDANFGISGNVKSESSQAIGNVSEGESMVNFGGCVEEFSLCNTIRERRNIEV